jgi:EAL domain-containing protein (putative c-di-GMP-specific phosphodiesterase class I)
VTAIRGRVLFVDDDEQVARAYERILIKAGYAVVVSNDPREAVSRFRQGGFDVVVSDVRMPGMSGLDLLRAIRERDLDVPVIIMTGSPEVQSATEAIEHGAFRYLTKPVDFGQLLNLVARAVRLHEMARVRREALQQHDADVRYGSDRAGIEGRFNRALTNLWIAYQPIVSWSRRSLFAYEALVRTEEPTLGNPAHLFDAAERLKRLPELGQAIRRQVAATLAQVPSATPVFVNVHPADLQDETLFAPDSLLSAFASQVVLEITERAAIDEVPDLIARMAQLRGMGFRIALDDLGAGYAGLASFAQLEPEVVKIDMSIVRGISDSTTKQRLFGSIVSLCHDLDIHLVAEGIETVSERDTVVGLGGDLCQGYLFARPARPFPVPNFAGSSYQP